MSLGKNKKFIIFDLDGTLINSIPDLRNAVNHALTKKGYNEISLEEITPMIGNGLKEMVGGALDKVKGEKASDEELDDVIKIYKEHYTNNLTVDTYLYPHVPETLANLQGKGYKMVICTNKPYDFVEPIIKDLKIKSFFEEWIGEGSLEVKKPDPGPLNYLMKKHGFTKEETVMVGDSRNDIQAAQNAGVDSIGLSFGYNYHEPIADYNPTEVVNSFDEIQDLL
ncbi:MAG: phosphoglycolate phosphatase [Weeksellaceae bacterium]